MKTYVTAFYVSAIAPNVVVVVVQRQIEPRLLVTDNAVFYS